MKEQNQNKAKTEQRCRTRMRQAIQTLGKVGRCPNAGASGENVADLQIAMEMRFLKAQEADYCTGYGMKMVLLLEIEQPDLASHKTLAMKSQIRKRPLKTRLTTRL